MSPEPESFGFEQSLSDPCVYRLFEQDSNENPKMIVTAHVDDLIVAGKANDFEELRKYVYTSFLTKNHWHTVIVVRSRGTGNVES